MKNINNRDMAVIVLHEIYGINEHITEVCEQLSKSGYDAICPNILELSRPFNYSQEEQAYLYFQENIGFTKASLQLKEIIEKIRTKYRKIFLFGFSIGATTAWLCSEDEGVDGIICYYGSRIRDYLKIEPRCPTLLIFANQEKSTKIEDLLAELQRKENVKVHVLFGKHGFADRFSNNYSEVSDLKAAEIVNRFLILHNDSSK